MTPLDVLRIWRDHLTAHFDIAKEWLYNPYSRNGIPCLLVHTNDVLDKAGVASGDARNNLQDAAAILLGVKSGEPYPYASVPNFLHNPSTLLIALNRAIAHQEEFALSDPDPVPDDQPVETLQALAIA